MTRKMATIRKIDDIRPIPDADAIETAVIGGWTVVIKCGEFTVGDLAVYCEIDSWIPNHLAPFLSKGQEPREFEGIKGERLRTVRLKKQLSQGLLLPMSCLTNFGADLSEGDDVAETLGIVKWEATLSAQLAGDAVGLFPSWIQKTDQERIQNLTSELAEWKKQDITWEVTEKLDGCLVEGTQISTPGGNIAVENINVGDKIISFNHDTSLEEESIVTGVLHREVESAWYEIETDDGSVLTVTANHPVFVTGINCYRRADQLKIGDNLTKKL